MSIGTLEEAILGSLIGTAAGDALGLPFEGISPKRIRKMVPGNLEHRFLFGRGMISDDTEHAFMTACSIAEHPNDAGSFTRAMGWRLRWWIAMLPAGVGLATLKACLKLWIGFPARKSGIRSAGNGPAMRASIIGVFFRDQPEKIKEYVSLSTRLTHTDPKALIGSLAIATAAAYSSQHGPDEEFDINGFLDSISFAEFADPDWQQLHAHIRKGLQSGSSVREFSCSLGLSNGVTGYIYHTVPVVLFAWLVHGKDFARMITELVLLGGDTDTTAAIAGGIAGAGLGEEGIPVRWRDSVTDWPINIPLLRRLAAHMTGQSSTRRFNALPYRMPFIFCRNLFFFVIVLLHAARRLFPPYADRGFTP